LKKPTKIDYNAGGYREKRKNDDTEYEGTEREQGIAGESL